MLVLLQRYAAFQHGPSDPMPTQRQSDPPLVAPTVVPRAFGEPALIALLDLAPTALCLCDLEGNLQVANAAAARLFGWGGGLPADGVRWLCAAKDSNPSTPSVLISLLRERPLRREQEVVLVGANGRPFDAVVTVQLQCAEDGKPFGAAIAVEDVSDQKSRERNQALLKRLAVAIALETEESAIIRITTAMVGEHLGVDRCGFVENEAGGRAVKVIAGWRRGSCASLAGRHDLERLGDVEWLNTLGSSLIAIADVVTYTHTRDYADQYRARGIRSFAGAPFLKEGLWIASLTVTSGQPRVWAQAELSLLEDVVARVWPLIERARAKGALQLFVNDAPVILSYFDRDSRVVFANRAFASRWGFDPAAMVGKHIVEVLGPDAYDVVRPHIENVLSGQPVQFEAELPYIGLGRRFVRASYAPDFDGNGTVRGYLSAVSDITERRTMEEALRQSEQRYRNLVDVLPVAIYVCDTEGRLLLYNDAATELWGRCPALGSEQWGGALAAFDPSGRPIPRDDWPLAHALRVGDAGKPREAIIERPDGSRRYVVSHPRLMRDASGAITGALNVLVDTTEQKAAEENVRDRDERLMLATRAGNLGIWDWDITADRITWTDSLYELHGVNPEQFSPNLPGFAALVHPDDRAHVVSSIEASLAEKEVFEAEFRSVKPDGAIIWLYTHARVLRNGGRPVRLVGATLDITERKRAELALSQSEQRFRTLAQHAPVGIFQADPQGACVFVNSYWCRLTGMTGEAARDGGWMTAIYPDDRPRIMAAWSNAVTRRATFALEHRFLRPDGLVLWVIASAVQFRGPDGQILGYIGTVMDVTERKAAEFALMESEKRFRLVASRAPVGIFMADAEGEFEFVNSSWCSMAGIGPEQAVRSEWMVAVHPGDRERVSSEWREAVRSGASWKAEHRFLRSDGSVTWVAAMAVQLRGASGRAGGYIGTVADFTERKTAELALRESEERLRHAQDDLRAHADDLEKKVEARTASLREAISQMEEFSYSVSHDLRAPLRAMNGYAEALMEDYGSELDDTGREYLRRIQRSSQRMEKLTHDVLTYSRLARAEIVPVCVDPAAVLRDLVSQYSELQSEAADIEIEEPLHRVKAHELSLGQCLGNLLTNAAKFVPAGRRPRIRVYTTAEGDLVRIWVSDNGIGIPQEHHATLFQMFQRVPTKLSYEGTGVGLAIVRKAMEKMGGRYGVESDGQTGSRFWIELPGG